MKGFYIYLWLVWICACKPQESKQVSPTVQSNYILKSSSSLVISNDIAFENNQRFSGFLYELDANGRDTLSIEGFTNGELQGVSKKWYAKGQLMEERYYTAGKKNGKQTAFWENGNKKFEFMAKDDAYEGELKEWTSEGKLFHLGTYVNGQEEGTQKLWYDNGKIRANYVIIKGKRYGLLGTKNCMNVSDRIFATK